MEKRARPLRHLTGRCRAAAVILLVCLSLLFFLPRKGRAAEVFVYDIKWMGIKAGQARLEFTEMGETLRIVSLAKSAGWLSAFYKVDDRVESLVVKRPDPLSGKAVWTAKRYRLKIREGRHRRHKEVVFDAEKGVALCIDYLKKVKRSVPVAGNALDPLSGFFLLRRMPIEVSRPLQVVIFDSQRIWDVRVDVLRREETKTPLGRFRTVVIKPNLKSEGIFNRKGDIYIYLSDDDRHIPVRIKTKVAVGYIDAVLVGGDF